MKEKINEAIISILQACAFFGVYFGAQLVCTAIFTFIFSFVAAFKGVTDLNDITEMITAHTMELTVISNAIAIIGCIFVMIWVRPERDTLADRLDIRIEFSKKWQILGTALALGVFGQLAISLVLNLIPFPQSWIDAQIESSAVIIDSPMLIQFIGVAIMAPLAEEIVFRACIQGTLQQGLPAWLAILIASLVFGVMHLSPISIIYATLLGILMGWIYYAFNSIIPSMIFHFGFNLLSLLLSESTPLVFYIISAVIFAICLGYLIYLSKKNNDIFIR